MSEAPGAAVVGAVRFQIAEARWGSIRGCGEHECGVGSIETLSRDGCLSTRVELVRPWFKFVVAAPPP